MTTILLGETLTVVVTYVSDGDTLHLKTKSDKYKIRFYGIGAPESSQKYGLEAKEFVLDRVLNEQVTVEVTDTDQYGRKVGKVYYNGKYLNEEVVKIDMLGGTNTMPRTTMILNRHSFMPRSVRLGLWKSKNPLEPWNYRKENKSIDIYKKTEQLLYNYLKNHHQYNHYY